MRDFWGIVERSKAELWSEQLERLTAELGALNEADLAGFRACFSGLMRYACSWGLWDAGSLVLGGMDSHAFFGLRAWLISRGRAAFEEVLAEPDTLADHTAYRFHQFAEVVAGSDSRRTKSYEEELTGEPLDDDDDDAFESTFPTLWAKHRGMRARVAAQRAWLYSVDERRRVVRRVRVGFGAVVVAAGTALWFLPWAYGLATTAALLAAFMVWFIRGCPRWTAGAFVSRGRDVGSATTLTGDVSVAVVYAQPGSAFIASWADKPVAAAFRFLQDEARRHGVELRLNRVPAEPIRLDSPQLFDSEFEDYAEASIMELEQRILPLLPRSNAFVLVITPEGRCTPTAWPATRFAPRGMEFCVCPVDASAKTIAHEILHLFGAADLYRRRRAGTFGANAATDEVVEFVASITDEHIPQTSVMSNGDGAWRTVDPVTALAVGWTDKLAGVTVPLMPTTTR